MGRHPGLVHGSCRHGPACPQGLIGTEQAAGAEQAAAPRSAAHLQLHRALDREELAPVFKERGVSTSALRERVNAPTDAEAAQRADLIDCAPAGGAAGRLGLVGLCAAGRTGLASGRASHAGTDRHRRAAALTGGTGLGAQPVWG
jgi:hypothetical protein